MVILSLPSHCLRSLSRRLRAPVWLFAAPCHALFSVPSLFSFLLYIGAPSLPLHFPAPSQPLGARFSRFPAKSPAESPEMALKTAVLTGFAKSECENMNAFHKKVRFFVHFLAWCRYPPYLCTRDRDASNTCTDRYALHASEAAMRRKSVSPIAIAH